VGDTPRIHLASASPRRREILASLGVRHTWQGVDVDETPLRHEGADELALRLAVAKARAARAERSRDAVILGADTVVSLDGDNFGKAASEREALFMLSRLSGREHTVVTAVALCTPNGEMSALSQSRVRFRAIDTAEAMAYWRSGEPEGKAGAYAIQGIGGIFVAALSGSYSGVVGLPVFETAGLLRQAGIDLLRRTREGPQGNLRGDAV
jgi:septum formation protein